jgi:hypothetical protein
VTNKTQEEILASTPENLTDIEKIIQELILDYGMNLEQAIAALEELP